MKFDKRLSLTVAIALGVVLMVGSCTNSEPPLPTILPSGGLASTSDETALEPSQKPVAQSDAPAPAQLQIPVSSQNANDGQAIYDVEEAVQTNQSRPQSTASSTASNGQEAAQPVAETVQLTIPAEPSQQPPSQIESSQQPLSQNEAPAPALQSPVSGQTANDGQAIYDVEEAVQTNQGEPQSTDSSTASNGQEATQPEAETVPPPPEEVEEANEDEEDENELETTGIVATLTDTELVLQDGTVFLVNSDTEFEGDVVAGTEVEVEYNRSNGKLMTCPPRTGPGVMLVLGLKERGVKMARRKHTAEQIINKLREAEVAISAGSTVAEVSRQIGVTQQTFYRWRTEYGGLKIDQARRLKQLETENGRLRRAVADLTLDNQILREAAEGNF